MEKNVRLFFGIGLGIVLIIVGLASGCDSGSIGGSIPTNGFDPKPVCVPIVERVNYSPAVVMSPSLTQTIHKLNLTNPCDDELDAIRVKLEFAATFPVGKWMILDGATTIAAGEGSDAGAEMEYNLVENSTRQFYLVADTNKARTGDSLSARVAAPIKWQMGGMGYESADRLPLAWTTFTY